MRMGTRLALFFSIIMAVVIVLLSWFYAQNASTAIAARTDAQLDSIGLLKIAQLDYYKTEEMSHIGRMAGRLASSGGGMKSALAGELAVQSDFNELFVMDPNGTVAASTDASEEGMNVSKESYFTGGEAGTVFMSRFYPPGSGKAAAYFIATPIKDGSGRTVAVLGARANLNMTSTLMHESAGMGTTGEAFLTDGYGVPITALKKTRNGTAPLHTLAVTDCLKGNNGSATYPDYHGDLVIERYFWLQDSDMCLISKIDSSEALAPITQVDETVMLMAMVLLLTAFAAAILIVRSVFAPIDELTRVVSAISKGDMRSELNPRLKESEDEIGKLARAFDRTLVSLKLAMKETAPELKIQSRALKEALAERTKAEARYRALVKTSPDAVVVTDPTGIISEVSSRTVELFGGESASELLGRDAFELMPPEMRGVAKKAIMKSLDIQGALSGIKLTLQRKDGSKFTGEINMKRLTDAAGNHVGTILTLRDITRREAEDKALREALDERTKAEARYKTLVETSPDAVTATDLKGILTEVSERTARLHGYGSAAEIVGKNAFDLIAPQDRQKAGENMSLVMKKGAIENLRYRMLRKDGSMFIGELNAGQLKDPAGRVIGFIATTRDVTKRQEEDDALRKAEKELEGERNLAKKYLDIADVMLVAIGADQKVTLINRKGCEVLGYKESEIIGKKWFDTFVPKKARERTKATFIKLMAGEITGVEYYENEVLAKNGGDKLIAWHNTILRDDGRIIGTLSSGEDITKRKVTEERLGSLGRFYGMSEDIGRMAADARSKGLGNEEIFGNMCRILVEKGGFRMAWVGLADARTRMVKPIAHAGVETGYLDNIRISMDNVPEGQGPTGIAIRENRSIIIDDWANDPRMKPWRAAGTKRGYWSSAAIPLQKEGKAIGALNAYSEKTGFFDHETMRALESITGMVAAAAFQPKGSKKR